MKTILHTIDTTGPGGAETVFIDLATRLSQDQYRSIIVIRGKGWVYEELLRRGMKPILMDAKGSFNWQYLKNLVALIHRERVDLIQSHLLGSNVYCSLAGLLTRKPVVSTFHGAVDIAEEGRLKGLKFAAINFGTRSIVTVSHNLRDTIISRTTLRESKVRVIYNGIRTEDFRRTRMTELRDKFGWTADDIIIGCLGNIRAAKGYDVLLKAVARLKRSPQFKFLIAGHGKGQMFKGLLELRSELELTERVNFLGFNDDPAGFLANIDLFLLPSTSEGFSIATIQAMAAGLPVIVTRSGGPEEIVTNGENGWMIEPGSPEAIAKAVEGLSADRALSEMLAAKGREHAIQTFDLDTMLRAYEAIYDDLS